jgi:hypothetical protein
MPAACALRALQRICLKRGQTYSLLHTKECSIYWASPLSLYACICKQGSPDEQSLQPHCIQDQTRGQPEHIAFQVTYSVELMATLLMLADSAVT